MSAKRKTCITCGKMKAAGVFVPGRNQCIPCRNEVYGRLVANNPEKVAAIQSHYRETHREHLKEIHHNWYVANRERVKKNKLRWIAANRERVREYHRQYAEDNRERLAEYLRKYRDENREKLKEYRRRYIAAKKAKAGKADAAATVKGTAKTTASRVHRPVSLRPQPTAIKRRKSALRGASGGKAQRSGR